MAKFGAVGDTTELEFWRETVLAGTAQDHVARLLDRPEYDEAVRRSILGSLHFYDSEPETNAIFREMGTFGLGVLALYLDSTGGITHRRLAGLGNTSTILSAGRASAILGLLRAKGLVTREAATNGLPARYLPSAQMTHFFCARFKVDLSALIAVEPALQTHVARWEEPGVFPRFMALLGGQLVRAAQDRDHQFKSFNDIGTYRAGFLILNDLLMRADRGGPLPALEPFDIPVSEVARRFSVSRAHVRRLIDRLESSGYLVRDQSGAGCFQPTLGPIMRHYFALGHVTFMGFAHEAMRG